MTHRERHTPEEAPARDVNWTPSASASASDSSSGAPSGASSVPPVAASGRRDAGPAGDLWTDWYQRASPAQQQEALLRAIHQGVVYAHQLAAPTQTAAPLRSVLSSLLNGQVKEMASLQPPALEYQDTELDRMQREAVARAVATPDVCLIQGLPGTGKSRLVAEIVLQAAKRGERVLLLAPTTVALDSVLERLSQHPAVCPIRCLAAEENPAELPPAIARLTLPERMRSYRETTLPAARASRVAAFQTLEARQRELTHWPRLEMLAEQDERLAERSRILSERRDGISAEVERLEPSVLFGDRWRVCQRERADALESVDGQLAVLQAELETIAAKQVQLDSEWGQIRPLAEARQKRRLWTGAWWRALFRSGLREQADGLEARRTEMHATGQRLEQELETRRSERAQIENRYAAKIRSLQEEEITRRRAEIDKDIAAVTCEQDALHEQWQTVRAAVSCDVVSTKISRQAVLEGRATWEELRERDAQRALAAEQWLQTVEEGVRTLPDKLTGCASVIAATTTMLSGDSSNGAPRIPPVFDLLILEQTHQVTEPEFAAAAHRARRLVLIGEPQAEDDEREALATGSPPSLTFPARRRSPRAPHPFFQRLWQHLHADPCRLPFTWMRRENRLLCRLWPFYAGQQKWIETEPVVDRPDIELRILSAPRQAPRIVEVLFPVNMGISEAKQFIFHELEELAVQTRGRSLCWSETAEEVILEFAPRGDYETVMVALEDGVRERVSCLPAEGNAEANGGMSWHTCSLEFSRAAGWTRQRAEDWVGQRLGLCSPGRTVLLTTSYRLDSSPAHSTHSCPTWHKSQTTNHTNSTNQAKKDRKNVRGRRS